MLPSSSLPFFVGSGIVQHRTLHSWQHLPTESSNESSSDQTTSNAFVQGMLQTAVETGVFGSSIPYRTQKWGTNYRHDTPTSPPSRRAQLSVAISHFVWHISTWATLATVLVCSFWGFVSVAEVCLTFVVLLSCEATSAWVSLQYQLLRFQQQCDATNYMSPDYIVKVRRDGVEAFASLPQRHLVVGDVIYVQAGDVIGTFDALVVSGSVQVSYEQLRENNINNSAGNINNNNNNNSNTAHDNANEMNPEMNTVLLGSSRVVAGAAIAVVCAVGPQSSARTWCGLSMGDNDQLFLQIYALSTELAYVQQRTATVVAVVQVNAVLSFVIAAISVSVVTGEVDVAYSVRALCLMLGVLVIVALPQRWVLTASMWHELQYARSTSPPVKFKADGFVHQWGGIGTLYVPDRALLSSAGRRCPRVISDVLFVSPQTSSICVVSSATNIFDELPNPISVAVATCVFASAASNVCYNSAASSAIDCLCTSLRCSKWVDDSFVRRVSSGATPLLRFCARNKYSAVQVVLQGSTTTTYRLGSWEILLGRTKYLSLDKQRIDAVNRECNRLSQEGRVLLCVMSTTQMPLVRTSATIQISDDLFEQKPFCEVKWSLVAILGVAPHPLSDEAQSLLVNNNLNLNIRVISSQSTPSEFPGFSNAVLSDFIRYIDTSGGNVGSGEPSSPGLAMSPSIAASTHQSTCLFFRRMRPYDAQTVIRYERQAAIKQQLQHQQMISSDNRKSKSTAEMKALPTYAYLGGDDVVVDAVLSASFEASLFCASRASPQSQLEATAILATTTTNDDNNDNGTELVSTAFCLIQSARRACLKHRATSILLIICTPSVCLLHLLQLTASNISTVGVLPGLILMQAAVMLGVVDRVIEKLPQTDSRLASAPASNVASLFTKQMAWRLVRKSIVLLLAPIAPYAIYYDNHNTAVMCAALAVCTMFIFVVPGSINAAATSTAGPRRSAAEGATSSPTRQSSFEPSSPTRGPTGGLMGSQRTPHQPSSCTSCLQRQWSLMKAMCHSGTAIVVLIVYVLIVAVVGVQYGALCDRVEMTPRNVSLSVLFSVLASGFSSLV
eukprot:PhM_4_TR5588/c0_g1_i1/m.29675